jgi:uncharacterized membrane protein
MSVLSNADIASLYQPRRGAPLQIHQLQLHDMAEALRAGYDDWLACSTYAITFAVVLPMATAFVGASVAAPSIIPFLFPILSGLALLGPLATMWFAALSRVRERNPDATMEDAAAVFDTPRRLTLQWLAVAAVALFLAWIAAAWEIYHLTLAHAPGGQKLLTTMFSTHAGWTMIAAGTAVGMVFALAALAIGLISFPLALDRDVTAIQVISASIRAVAQNLVFSLVWGLLVTGGLILGMVPALLGLGIVMPIFGHASWHIYRRAIG